MISADLFQPNAALLRRRAYLLGCSDEHFEMFRANSVVGNAGRGFEST